VEERSEGGEGPEATVAPQEPPLCPLLVQRRPGGAHRGAEDSPDGRLGGMGLDRCKSGGGSVGGSQEGSVEVDAGVGGRAPGVYSRCASRMPPGLCTGRAAAPHRPCTRGAPGAPASSLMRRCRGFLFPCPLSPCSLVVVIDRIFLSQASLVAQPGAAARPHGSVPAAGQRLVEARRAACAPVMDLYGGWPERIG
jgi:hypothetical protein